MAAGTRARAACVATAMDRCYAGVTRLPVHIWCGSQASDACKLDAKDDLYPDTRRP